MRLLFLQQVRRGPQVPNQDWWKGGDLPSITKSWSPNNLEVEVDFEGRMSDFKEVGGMNIAHAIITFQGGAEAQNITFTEIKINTGLEDSLFKRDEFIEKALEIISRE